MNTLTLALALAAKNRVMIPMNPQTKRPACEHGVKDATRCTETITAWFSRPGLVPAVATGEPSGVIVLDIDRQHDGAIWWQENRQRLPETEAYRTRSGGLHLVFNWRPGIRTTAIGKIGTGVEIRSTGASAIYWPAMGMPMLCEAAPVDLPEWVLPPPPQRPERPAERFTVADDASVGHLIRFATSAAPGQRNARLFWAGCRLAEMVRAGTLQNGYAVSLIEQAGTAAGLPIIEARATALSAIGGAK